jgi:hypothetical protein
MYFGPGGLDFDTLVAFVVGFDLGTHGRLLEGFREYLILRLGEESSLGWPGLAIAVSAPQAAPRPTTPDDDHQAAVGLFDLLDEYLAEFPEDRSRSRLIHEYFIWKQHLSFFDLNLERFRSSPPPDMISVEAAMDLLGTPRTALFDLVAPGNLEIFRIEATLLVSSSRVTELRDQRVLGATGDGPWEPDTRLRTCPPRDTTQRCRSSRQIRKCDQAGRCERRPLRLVDVGRRWFHWTSKQTSLRWAAI